MATKTIILFLFMSITMTMFCSSEAGFDAEPDSVYAKEGCGPYHRNLGDKITFLYCSHNVIRVHHDDFFFCNPTNPISALVDDTFTFEEFGDYYFICSDPHLCDDLQRDFIRVGSYEPISPAPAPSSRGAPVPSPGSAPAPVPSPGSAPAPARFTFA